MSTWQDFELPKLPAVFTTAVSSVQKINAALTTVLSIVKATLDVVAALQVANLTASQAIIKAAITAIEQALLALANDTGVYVLLVPVRKKVVLSPIVNAALVKAGMSKLPDGPVPPGLISIQSTMAAGSSGFDQKLLSYFDGTFNADAGNQGYLRTVLESLVDTGDENRPQLQETDAVAGITIVAGATDYLQILDFLANFKALFAPRSAPSTLEVAGLPVPQNVKVRTVASSGQDEVLLSWDTTTPIVEVPSLGIAVKVNKVAVLRSTDPMFMAATSIPGIFGPGDLTIGKKIGTDVKGTVVLDIVDFSYTGLRNSYRDTSTRTAKTTYYYALAYDVAMGSLSDIAGGTSKHTGFRTISNVVKLSQPKGGPPKSALSTAPDWVRTPSVLALVPDFATFIDQMNAFFSQSGGLTIGYGDVLKTYTTFLQAEIDSFAGVAAQFTGIVDRLTGLLGTPFNVGVYERSFAGVGGNNFFIQDLTQSLAPGSDPKRPPFDNGEFVAGMIILAAAPTAAGLAPVMALLNQIIGNVGAQGSAIADAIASIDKVLGVAEAAAGINQDFTTADTAVPEPVQNTQSQPLIGADDDGKKDLNCPPPATISVTLGDNFLPTG